MLGLAVVPEVEARASRAHEFIHTLEGLLELVSAAGSQFGVVVDAWAMHIAGEPLSLLSQVPAGRIVEIRLSDAPRERAAAEFSHADRLLPGETGVIACGPLLQAAEKAGFDGPVTPWADRSAVAGRGREKLVKLAGDRMEAAWKDAGLPILPRWFLPTQKDGPRDGFEVEGLEPAKNAAGRLVGQGG
jgi:sugar phosphate isomerase/epimerase